MNLPKRKTQYYPLWVLIDVDYENHGPPLASTNVWPIQTSSPNSARWKAWRKQTGGALLGMPLWNMDELMKGYVFSLFSFLPSRSSLTVLRFLVYIFSPNLMTFRAD